MRNEGVDGMVGFFLVGYYNNWRLHCICQKFPICNTLAHWSPPLNIMSQLKANFRFAMCLLVLTLFEVASLLMCSWLYPISCFFFVCVFCFVFGKLLKSGKINDKGMFSVVGCLSRLRINGTLTLFPKV